MEDRIREALKKAKKERGKNRAEEGGDGMWSVGESRRR